MSPIAARFRCELVVVPPVIDETEELDHAAGARDVVRGVEDPGRAQPFGILRLGQLVVRRPRDHRATQARDRVRVQRAADRARRIDVALGLERALGRDRRAADLRRDRLGPSAVDV